MIMTSSDDLEALGVRFDPTDDDLLRYLLWYVCGSPLACHCIRSNVDLYADKKPSLLFHDDVNYFYTQLKKKVSSSSRTAKNYQRTLASGAGEWHGLDKGKPLLSQKGIKVGFKKSFRFQDQGSDKRFEWRMKEYCLSDGVLNRLRKEGKLKHEDHVLCCVTRKATKAANNVPMVEDVDVVMEQPLIIPAGYSVESQSHHYDYSCDHVPITITTSLEEEQAEWLRANATNVPILVEENCTPIIDHVVEQQQGYSVEYQSYHVNYSSCGVPTMATSLEEEQEWLGAKANLPTEEEPLSELKNLYNHDDDCRSFLTTAAEDQSMSQLPCNNNVEFSEFPNGSGSTSSSDDEMPKWNSEYTSSSSGSCFSCINEDDCIPMEEIWHCVDDQPTLWSLYD